MVITRAPCMTIPENAHYLIPTDKWETAIWLANYFMSRDLGRYKHLPRGEKIKQICENHRMKYSEGLGVSELGWRLTRKLYKEKRKNQLYAIYFGITNPKKPTSMETGETEIESMIQPETEESKQILLFPKEGGNKKTREEYKQLRMF